MNNLGISTDPALLGVDLPSSLTTSPSVSTFMPEEDASICPLLPTTPSPPPMDFIHPLTPSTGIDEGNNEDLGGEFQGDDAQADSSSSGSSSGIGIQVTANGPGSLFNKHAYQHLGSKNGDITQDNGVTQTGVFSIPMTKDTPSFVNWNWPLIRKCTFFLFMSGLFAMCAIVVAMMFKLPKSCNPEVPWYKGAVFYEIFPASFQDSNGDGLGDLKGLASRIDYLESLGVGAVRLNSIFPAKHYPDHFQNVTTLLDIDEILGTPRDLTYLARILQRRNISLILDLPIYPLVKHLAVIRENFTEATNSTDTEDEEVFQDSDTSEDPVLTAMRFWLSMGVDGFYVKGLENYAGDPYLIENLQEWKFALGSDRILMVSKLVFDSVDDDTAEKVRHCVDLVDVFVDVSNGTKVIAEKVQSILNSRFLAPGFGPWIHWSLGGVTERRLAQGTSSNISLAATLMQLMLPGTPSIFYGDEVALQEVYDPLGEHEESKHLHHLSTMVWDSEIQFTVKEHLPWLPRGAFVAFHHFEHVAGMIRLRGISPSIYQNAVIKEHQSVLNTAVRYSKNDILILERWYPRRNTFTSISNFGSKSLVLDLSGMFYAGEIMLGSLKGEKVFFSSIQVKPMETIIVKLDK
ncbi:neutral and basic amino acid transport protein rBAT-like [Lutzomyia longipalpis]|uniref:neutral and basic amino acid transport protein rBAT-like n=1 Tax=Lutzomyia longipalpis TaxID=7200 RepID=UPI0024840B6C|nr:neutral and basic amino acid transport protein rBAT-like [Lutzomyia longipalpis]